MVGALLQTTTRNDLADPFLFGLSSGASAGVVLVMTRLGDSLGAWTLPVSSFAGGMLSAAVVLVIFMTQSQKGTEKLIICGSLATALLVALTGVIGFVGLMVPHLARPFTGVRHRRLLPLVGVLGAILLSAGDLLSRVITAPQELPIGIITAGLGGVFVLVILLRRAH